MENKRNQFLILVISLMGLVIALFVVASVFNSFTQQVEGFDTRLANLEKASNIDNSVSDADSIQADRIERLEDSISHLTKAMTVLAEGRASQSADKKNLVAGNSQQAQPFDMEVAKENARQQKEFLSQTFKDQAVDESWAPNAATRFDKLQSNPKLQVAQITNVDCRQSLCKADIAQPKMAMAEAADFENHLLMELTKQFKGGLSMSREIQPDGLVKMVVYTVREGHQIPVNNSQKAFAQ